MSLVLTKCLFQKEYVPSLICNALFTECVLYLESLMIDASLLKFTICILSWLLWQEKPLKLKGSLLNCEHTYIWGVVVSDLSRMILQLVWCFILTLICFLHDYGSAEQVMGWWSRRKSFKSMHHNEDLSISLHTHRGLNTNIELLICILTSKTGFGARI